MFYPLTARRSRAHRVNLDDRLEAVLGQFGDRRKEVPSSTYKMAQVQSARVVCLRRTHGLYTPHMTKSILPYFSIVLATASWSCFGFLTSA